MLSIHFAAVILRFPPVGRIKEVSYLYLYCGNKDRAMMVIAVSLCSDKHISVYKTTAGTNKFHHIYVSYMLILTDSR